MAERCDNCLFRGTYATGIPASPTRLICRRFPPSSPSRVTMEWNSPIVSPDHWCGEYRRGDGVGVAVTSAPRKPLVEVARVRRTVTVTRP